MPTEQRALMRSLAAEGKSTGAIANALTAGRLRFDYPNLASRADAVMFALARDGTWHRQQQCPAASPDASCSSGLFRAKDCAGTR